MTDGRAGSSRLVATLVRDAAGRGADRSSPPFVETAAALLAAEPDVIVEAAGHEVVRTTVPGFLRAGVDTLIVSIGALADDQLFEVVSEAATSGRSRLLLATGAVGSLDALSAARCLGLDRVLHTLKKPFASLGQGVPPTLGGELMVFSGSARDAALAFPANANVVAAVGFAGIGLDRTEVRIIASTIADRNTHEIHATGAFGELNFRIANRSMPENPRSSLLAAGSLAAALARRTASVAVA